MQKLDDGDVWGYFVVRVEYGSSGIGEEDCDFTGAPENCVSGTGSMTANERRRSDRWFSVPLCLLSCNPWSCRHRSSTQRSKERKPCPTRLQARSRAGCRRADGRSPSASAPSCSPRSCSSSTWIAIAPASAARTPRRRCSSRSSSFRRARPARSSRASRCTRRRRFRRRKSRSAPSPIPSYLSGRAAAADIFPGSAAHRRRTSRPATRASVDSQITGTQRAISISIDTVHG